MIIITQISECCKMQYNVAKVWDVLDIKQFNVSRKRDTVPQAASCAHTPSQNGMRISKVYCGLWIHAYKQSTKPTKKNLFVEYTRKHSWLCLK